MRFPILFPVTFATLLAAVAPAQGQDPMREIQELARRIDDQLRDIDKLLLESGQKNQVRGKQKDLLQKASESSTDTETRIDELIQKLTEMKNQSSSSGQPDDQQEQGGQQKPQNGQQKPDQGQNQGQQQARRENQTPEHVSQGEQQPGEGQKPQPQGQKPQGQKPQGRDQPTGGQESKDKPENRVGAPQPEPQLGPGNPGAGDESWGELQPYLNRLKNRGSAPKVPEKYRKYWQAYLRNKQGAGTK